MSTSKSDTKRKKTTSTKDKSNDVLTRKDLALLATKEDLKEFATKAELNSSLLSLRSELKENMRTLRAEFKNDLLHVQDAILGAIQNLREENAAGHHTLRRHEKWIRQIAVKTGVSLED